MKFIKKNYGWIIVAILALLPLIPISNFAFIKGNNNVEMLYHISGEFAIRWMTAVLTLTPFYILFGVSNLFVRQAMGIATALWSILHFVIFIIKEGFLETFTEINYIAGFIATLILVPLLITSNRKSMFRLKSNWKKLQRMAYVAIILSLLHILLLDKTWIIYAVVVGLGFIIRIPLIKNSISSYKINK
ncbi:ferric reductase [Flammeovirga pectinis]|uniref:Ferric reductase n=1 Tax=Flammeovirga pectinis TaxID=2494373 RepID=A0A3Q9FNT4_9BACT|nr:ferric reductase-like transmembrane domain-containing protein [Flammeovirga pectinis]AZQ63757.1 ferric reductase [Flammeovirga pectinis]